MRFRVVGGGNSGPIDEHGGRPPPAVKTPADTPRPPTTSEDRFWRRLRTASCVVQGGRAEATARYAKLLEIATKEERAEAFHRGEMVFYRNTPKGRERHPFPLQLNDKGTSRLVMPFFVGDNEYAIRFDKKACGLYLFEVADGREKEPKLPNFVRCDASDMGHISLPTIRGTGLSVPLLCIARDHALAKKGVARAKVYFDEFVGLLQSAGYNLVSEEKIPLWRKLSIRFIGAPIARSFGGEYVRAGITGKEHVLEVEGKGDERNNLNNHFRFVAIDPETNELKSFYFPVRKIQH